MKSIIFIIFILPFTTFGQTGSEYADLLVEAYLNPKHTKSNNFYGGFGRMYPIEVRPDVALGNNKYFISLPKGSYLVVQFTDNEIIDFPGTDDIFVTEVGCSDEHANIYVSHDGDDFTFLGTVNDCNISSLDLASIEYKLAVRYIKIEGLDSKGGSPGFDLVSIKGLPGANQPTYSTMDSIISTEKVIQNDKKYIFKNVLFQTNSAIIVDSSVTEIDNLVSYLKLNIKDSVVISGHTDNIGQPYENLILSESRAKSVVDYIINNGIQPSRLSFEGFGEANPIKSNETEEGRQINRRVEFRIIQN